VLHASFDGLDAAARWRSWAKVLGLPALVEDRTGDLCEADMRMGGVTIDMPQPHRGASPLSARRPATFGYSGQGRHWPERLRTGARPHAY